MGRMRFLRPIEFTNEEASLEEQKFSVDFENDHEESKECPNNNDGYNDLSSYNNN